MKILVTAFEPFGGQTMNPAQEAVGRLPSHVEGADISRVTLPVAFGRDREVLVQEIGRYDPDVCLCVGQAGGRAQVTPEFVGINYMLARIPDNERARPAGIPVVEGGPAAYFTTLPVHAMVARMRERGVPASVSYSAGTFCCTRCSTRRFTPRPRRIRGCAPGLSTSLLPPSRWSGAEAIFRACPST